jgi:general secretion pathway protein E
MPLDIRIVELPSKISREFLVHHRVCPAFDTRQGNLLLLHTHDSHADVALESLSEVFGGTLPKQLACWEEVERTIERSIATRAIESEDPDAKRDGPTSVADVRDLATQPPVIRYVNLVLREAFDAGASDLHLETTEGGISVRIRVDGAMRPLVPPEVGLARAIMSRIKLLADLDIADSRRPQDGRIRVRFDQNELDVRVSTVPATDGESIVLRLLNQSGKIIQLSSLGMPAHVLDPFTSATTARQGLVLVTGPTGSGKSTTLYAGLQLRDADSEKIVALEDPVEHRMKGVVQIPVERAAGLSFALLLRSVLRQDPDVMLIGEMRDAETAHIAVQAAMTGHLVLSTLHTNDAPSAITRLRDLGLPTYLIATALSLVVAQRLVRRVCQQCGGAFLNGTGERKTSEPLATGPDGSGYASDSCATCRGEGYKGRIGLFECTTIDDTARAFVASDQDGSALKRSMGQNWRSLAWDGEDKVRRGLTSTKEVLRAIAN